LTLPLTSVTVTHMTTNHSTCRSVALECINENATSAGCVPPAHGHWIEEDSIPEWGVDSVAELVTLYLEDGTSSHFCD
jgi:hypothetical protein